MYEFHPESKVTRALEVRGNIFCFEAGAISI